MSFARVTKVIMMVVTIMVGKVQTLTLCADGAWVLRRAAVQQ
jgi:hypothetical protein